MFIIKPGQITDNFHWIGSAYFPVFLLDGPVPVLFEGGVTYAGQAYVEGIRAVLGQREPAMIFVTHAHWDHCGAIFYLKRHFPSLKVVASPLVKGILQKQSARDLIIKLNEEIKKAIKAFPGADIGKSDIVDEKFQAFDVDIELSDGQIFDLGNGTTVQALSTPGHTRDHTSYYLPKDKILIGCEAAGLLEWSGNVSVEFAADYDDYVNSIKRLSLLPVDIYCQGHGLVMTSPEEVKYFFENSLSRALAFKDEVYQLLDEEQGDEERVIKIMKARHYDSFEGPKQPENTYVLNLSAQVRHLARKKAAVNSKE